MLNVRPHQSLRERRGGEVLSCWIDTEVFVSIQLTTLTTLTEFNCGVTLDTSLTSISHSRTQRH